MSPADFSVVVPAHDEAAVIARSLAFAADLTPGEAEIAVVANGCTDATAEVARAVPGVTVVELPDGGKAAALDAGDAAVSAFPRVYLDADVTLDAATLRRLVDAVRRNEPFVAAPRVRFRTDGRPWPVRAFYDVYRRLPYVTDGLVGLGVYALSKSGRRRFGTFPRVTGDDLFVQRLFRPQERVVLDDAWFDVQAPRTVRDLLRVRTRTAFGNRELAARDGENFARTTAGTGRSLLDLVARDPRRLPAAAVYAGLTLEARRRARGRDGGRWHRDMSTR